MAAKGKAIVAGATGMVGTRLVERLADDGWQVIGLCRNAPAGRSNVSYMALNLDDRAACDAKLGALHDVTHAFYASRAKHGESGIEPVDENLAMLKNLVEPLAAAPSALAHAHLVQGAKYYGVHLGPYKSPAKESDARHMPPNFYFDHQDYITQRADGFTWSIVRPPLIYDFVPRRPRNLVSVIGVFAAICRELDLPFSFPGPDAAYRCIAECASATQIAKAIVWMATDDRCANQAFNITNGDFFRWQNLWPRLAAYLGLETGGVRTLKLGTIMMDKAPVWQRIVERHGLEPVPFEDMALWSYADFALGAPYDMMSDTTKARHYGFHDVIDSEAMFIELLDRYRAAKLLP